MKKFLPVIALVLFGGLILVLSQRSNQQPTIPQKTTTDSTASSTKCSRQPLAELTEGPYYKAGSPQRQDITDAGTPGTHLILKGYVLDTNCNPVANVWLDFWQTDGNGNYDNQGYNLRGHQYTNEEGFFRIETVVPGEYPGRPPHIHFKVRKDENSRVITSQLFFPGDIQDSIFDDSLVVEYGTDPDGSKYADYNVIIP